MDHSACLASGGLVKLSVQLPCENLWETFFTLDVHDDVELSCVLGGLVHDVLRVVVQRAVVVAHLGAELLKRDGSSSPAHDAGENPFAAWWLISLCPPPPPGRGASPAWITFCSPAIPWPACSPKAKSSEVVVATPEGVVKTRTIKRLLQESRWDADAVIGIKGTPWAPIDGATTAPVPVSVHVPSQEHLPPAVGRDPKPQLRRMKIMRPDYDKHGYTAGCRGCLAMQHRKTQVLHTSACRERMKAALAATPAGADTVNF